MSVITENKFELTEKQKEAFNLMETGISVCIPGPAGTGKSMLIKKFVKTYRHSKNIGLTALTGISALQIGGSTLHSYCGIGLGNKSLDFHSTTILRNPKMRKRWQDLEILIIDEVSMLTPDLFDKLEKIAKCVRHSENPFGGIQLILSGDFLQLPCVNSDNFCFEADSWNECIQHTVYLDEIMRQSDPIFQNLLNNIRFGIVTASDKKILNSRVGVKLENDLGIKPTRLFSTNFSVDSYNQEELDKLAQDDDKQIYEYSIEYNVNKYVKNKDYALEKYKKLCIAPENLQLCKGAQVMLLFNMNQEEKLVNGSRGVITDFIEDMPIVKFMNGLEIAIPHHVWEIEEGDEKIMDIIQIPLKLSWGISGHKSQSLTLDYVEVDLSNNFEYGQSYVMLSRVKTLDGLSIIDINYDKIIAHPKAVKYYKELIDKK